MDKKYIHTVNNIQNRRMILSLFMLSATVLKYFEFVDKLAEVIFFI